MFLLILHIKKPACLYCQAGFKLAAYKLKIVFNYARNDILKLDFKRTF